MPALIDLTGRTFGQLTVVGLSERRKYRGQFYWDCMCTCGTETTVLGRDLRKGHTKSCGCRRLLNVTSLTHGQSGSPEYVAWLSMKNRCYVPSTTHYRFYGGRGITVCDSWRDSFETFLADIGPRPSPKHSLDRIDSDGNYEPSNVRWALFSVQANNRRRTRFVVYHGERMPLTDAVRAAGSVIHYEAAWVRIRDCGWTVERAVETPSSRRVKP